ncbi:MAG: adenosine kinase [bacterium]
MSHKIDVIAIGNAIVDVLSHCEDQFLIDNDIPKGGMMLIGAQQALEIYKNMGKTVEIAGGSAANSMACLASLGGAAGFIGKLGQDRLGEAFRNSLNTDDIVFETAAMTDHTPTGRCLINVTPDAERSMMTFIGAAEHVSVDDVSDDFIATAAITYFEGYLFEQENPRKGMVKACQIAKKAGRKTALTLSDTSCVDRQHGAYTEFIKEHTDIVFANEEEAKALARTNDLREAIAILNPMVPYLVVTRSEKGSVLCGPDAYGIEVPAVAPDALIDTTGAGDAFAGGFFYGFTRGKDLAECAHLGSLAASEVISHMGPRPEQPLRDLL